MLTPRKNPFGGGAAARSGASTPKSGVSQARIRPQDIEERLKRSVSATGERCSLNGHAKPRGPGNATPKENLPQYPIDYNGIPKVLCTVEPKMRHTTRRMFAPPDRERLFCLEGYADEAEAVGCKRGDCSMFEGAAGVNSGLEAYRNDGRFHNVPYVGRGTKSKSDTLTQSPTVSLGSPQEDAAAVYLEAEANRKGAAGVVSGHEAFRIRTRFYDQSPASASRRPPMPDSAAQAAPSSPIAHDEAAPVSEVAHQETSRTRSCTRARSGRDSDSNSVSSRPTTRTRSIPAVVRDVDSTATCLFQTSRTTPSSDVLSTDPRFSGAAGSSSRSSTPRGLRTYAAESTTKSRIFG